MITTVACSWRKDYNCWPGVCGNDGNNDARICLCAAGLSGEPACDSGIDKNPFLLTNRHFGWISRKLKVPPTEHFLDPEISNIESSFPAVSRGGSISTCKVDLLDTEGKVVRSSECSGIHYANLHSLAVVKVRGLTRTWVTPRINSNNIYILKQNCHCHHNARTDY